MNAQLARKITWKNRRLTDPVRCLRGMSGKWSVIDWMCGCLKKKSVESFEKSLAI